MKVKLEELFVYNGVYRKFVENAWLPYSLSPIAESILSLQTGKTKLDLWYYLGVLPLGFSPLDSNDFVPERSKLHIN